MRGLSIGATQARPGSDGKEREREAKQLQTMSQPHSGDFIHTSQHGRQRTRERGNLVDSVQHHTPQACLRPAWRRARAGQRVCTVAEGRVWRLEFKSATSWRNV